MAYLSTIIIKCQGHEDYLGMFPIKMTTLSNVLARLCETSRTMALSISALQYISIPRIRHFVAYPYGTCYFRPTAELPCRFSAKLCKADCRRR